MGKVEDKYEDIIALEHHQSATHPRMAMADRAAQFAPFAALTGFDGVIDETALEHVRRSEQQPGPEFDLP